MMKKQERFMFQILRGRELGIKMGEGQFLSLLLQERY
jgi:hypothetical protein